MEGLRSGIRQEAARLLHLLESSTFEKDVADAAVLRAEIFYSHLLRISHQGLAPGVATLEVVEIVRNIVEVLQEAVEELQSDSYQPGYQSLTLRTHQRGRPRYDIPRDQLVYFIEHGFTC